MTKRELKLENLRLRNQLDLAKEALTLKESGKYRECESTLCAGCVYAVKHNSPWGRPVYIGCAKDIACKDYTPKSTQPEERNNEAQECNKSCNCIGDEKTQPFRAFTLIVSFP